MSTHVAAEVQFVEVLGAREVNAHETKREHARGMMTTGFIAMNDTTKNPMPPPEARNASPRITPKDAAERVAPGASPMAPPEAALRSEVSTQKAARVATSGGVAASGGVATIEELQRAEKAGTLVMAARNSLRRGKREAARAQLQQAFAITSTDLAALELLGDLFLEEGEQQKAIAVFERGRKYHASHAAFEEKIALAHIDLEEMKRDARLKEAAMQGVLPIADKASERKPGSVAFLSLLLPGAGQYYNEEPERGAIFLGVSLVLFAAWLVPWRLDWWKLGGAPRMWIVAVLLAWFVSHVAAAVDAGRGVRREAEERKRTLGL